MYLNNWCTVQLELLIDFTEAWTTRNHQAMAGDSDGCHFVTGLGWFDMLHLIHIGMTGPNMIKTEAELEKP